MRKWLKGKERIEIKSILSLLYFFIKIHRNVTREKIKGMVIYSC